MQLINLKKCFLQFAAATPALLTVLTLATHLGWTSPALQQYLSGQNSIHLTNSQGSWFVSIISIGCVCGLVAMIAINNLIGRKLTIVALTIPLLLSWIIIVFAPNVQLLYVARLLGGVGMGMSATMVPIYTGEIATDDLRSALSSSFQIMLATGPIIEYAIVPYTTPQSSAAISAVIPILVLVLVYWMPESPYYLLIKNREDDARRELVRLRGHTQVDSELNHMKYTVKYQMVNKSSFKELLIRRSNRNGLFIMFGMYTIQAFCGTVVILFYAHTIFEKVQVGVSSNILALIMIFIPCISSFISTGVVEYTGKKPLLLISTFLCFCAMIGVGLYFHLELLGYDVTTLGWLPVLSLIGFKFVHGLGIAGIPFIQLGELFSANIKVHAVCTCKCYLFILHFTSNKLYQIISDNLGFYVPFYIFAGFSLFGVFFTIFCVPETTGKSLHEIQLQLGAKYKVEESNNNDSSIEKGCDKQTDELKEKVITNNIDNNSKNISNSINSDSYKQIESYL